MATTSGVPDDGVPDDDRAPAFAAVDLGASSGRVVVGRVLGALGEQRVELHEVHRFPNTPVAVGRGVDDGAPTLHWDVLALYRGVLDGLRAATREVGALSGVGIDTWAVDYGLLDADGVLLGNPVHYRDGRTEGVPDHVFATVPAADLYARTGVQVQPFNTVFQLVAADGSAQLGAARRLLLVPDLLAYWLTGAQGAEATNASTTGLLDVTTRTWAADLAEALGIDTDLLPPVCEAGTTIGTVRPEVLEALGQDAPLTVFAVGSHDTASAVVGVPVGSLLREVPGPPVSGLMFPGERVPSEGFAYISCGTWSLVGLELDAPVLTEESRAANFTNELGVDGTVRYLRNVMGLWVLQEAIRTWEAAGVPADLENLLADAAGIPALTTVVDVDDPAFLPPGDMPARIVAAAERTGQTPPASQAETVRCILDSLALAYRRAVRQAGALAGRTVDVVHVVGGGVRNTLLCQLTADATGLPVVAGPVEAAALGNVLVQARAAGVLAGDLAALREVGSRGHDMYRYTPGMIVPDDAAWDAAERRLRG